MTKFNLKGSEEYYLTLSKQPKRFEADSPVTNVFFDDTNGEVFSVRSGGVTGVTVTGMDDSSTTSFRMEDRGPIISIKFSPDHKILAIQRSQDNQSSSVEFVNFKDLAPTNVEYSQTCKWKNAKILGFVWPKVNEIAFITDHGIELLQVTPEKKQLKSLKNTSFSGAWYSWCARSSIVLLAGNNGALLQPFSLNNSTVTKLQKLELDSSKPVVERDVFILRLCAAAWCAVFRHGTTAAGAASGPTEVWLMPISGAVGYPGQHTHVLKTGLVGRFAVNVVDDLVVVHHQSSQTSMLFDIMEESRPESNTVIHVPIVPGTAMHQAYVDDQLCPMYSVSWVVFQPDYIVDARLGCLWRVQLSNSGLAHSIPKEEISKIVGVLLRRSEGRPTLYRLLSQLVERAHLYLVELGKAFDEVNCVYRKWADLEMARNTAGGGGGGCAGGGGAGVGAAGASGTERFPVLLSQPDVCTNVFMQHIDTPHIVQVVVAYLASLSRHELTVQHPAAELAVRALVTRGQLGRLKSLVRRGCLGESRPLACQLLSLGHVEPACAQLALDMMWRLKAYEEIVEVLLSWNEPIAGIGAARQAGAAVWHALPARKVLAAARSPSAPPGAFVAAYHALRERNDRLRGTTQFTKSEQCDSYVEYYKQITSD